MTRFLVPVALLAAACAPPPPVDTAEFLGPPTLRILYPADDVGEIPLESTPEGDVLELLVVVEFDDFQFVPFDPEANREDEERRGHWHWFLNGEYKGVPPDFFVEYQSTDTGPEGDYAPGTAVSLRAVLATHNHAEFENPEAESIVEFTVAAPPAE